MEYTYQIPAGYDFLVVLLKVERIVGRLPEGFMSAASSVTLTFNPDITPAQKTSLDTLMARTDVGVIPPNPGNTNYVFKDPLDWRSNFRTLAGLDFEIYPITNQPGGWSYEIQFNRPLNNADKNKLQNCWASWITLKTY